VVFDVSEEGEDHSDSDEKSMDECSLEDKQHRREIEKQEAAKPVFDHGDTKASKHAPLAVRSSMPIDEAKEMEDTEPENSTAPVIEDQKSMSALSSTAKTTKRRSILKTSSKADLRPFALSSSIPRGTTSSKQSRQ
jgi:hypothetical protein